MKYRREIDGLRAVAVLPVILFHAGFTIFSGGFVGVDVFFVISGFIMVHASARLFGKPGARAEFLRRRLVRIAPLYWLVTTAFLLLLAAARSCWAGRYGPTPPASAVRMAGWTRSSGARSSTM